MFSCLSGILLKLFQWLFTHYCHVRSDDLNVITSSCKLLKSLFSCLLSTRAQRHGNREERRGCSTNILTVFSDPLLSLTHCSFQVLIKSTLVNHSHWCIQIIFHIHFYSRVYVWNAPRIAADVSAGIFLFYQWAGMSADIGRYRLCWSLLSCVEKYYFLTDWQY